MEIPRDEALVRRFVRVGPHLTIQQARLEGAIAGAFIIRASEKTYAALTVISSSGPVHTHVEKDGRGLTSCVAPSAS